MTTITTGRNRKMETVVYNLNNGYKKTSGIGLSISDLVRMANDVGAYMDIIPSVLNDEYIIYNHNTDTGRRLTILDVCEDIDFNPGPPKYIIIELGPPAFYGDTATVTFTDDEKLYDEAYERYELAMQEEEYEEYVYENELNGQISLYSYIRKGEYIERIDNAFRTFLQSTCRKGYSPHRRMEYIDLLGLENAGIYGRLVFNIDGFTVQYVAGQSYPDEIRTLKKLILKR